MPSKIERLEDVRKRAAASPAGCLYPTATKMVFYRGNPESPLMIIGEAPGEKEDEQGLPFVGPSGKLVDSTLVKVGFVGSPYITNIILRRPPGNRDPSPEEVAMSLPWLEEQVSIVQPKVILTLGRFAGQVLSGAKPGISMKNLLGMNSFDFGKVQGKLVCAYHPAYILRMSIRSSAYECFLQSFSTAVNG